MNKISKKPKVSVLMTAYNAEQFVGRAIESILNQSYENYEFLIIDDGSTDNTVEVIQKYWARDQRISVFFNRENKGIAYCRNFLVARAQGKYIIWQDADDISIPRRIENQVGFMDKHPDVGICGGWLQFFDQAGPISIRKYETEDTKLRNTIFRFSPVAQPAAIIRASVVRNIKPLYEHRWNGTEDLDVSFKIGQVSKFANLPEVVLWYRQQTNSVTFSRLKELEKQTLSIRRKYRNKKYRMKVIDYLYNALQWATVNLMSPRLRIALFNLFRNEIL